MAAPNDHRWILLVYRIPSQPSRLRLQVWRKLQAVGAAYLQDAVCVLPDTEEHQKEIYEIGETIRKMGGTASLFKSSPLCEGQDEAVVESFKALADDRYKTILNRIDAALLILRTDVDMTDIEVAEESLMRERIAFLRSQKLAF